MFLYDPLIFKTVPIWIKSKLQIESRLSVVAQRTTFEVQSITKKGAYSFT